MLRLRLTFFVLPIIVLSAVVIYGQGTSGTILGTVTDPQGALVSGALVSGAAANLSLNRAPRRWRLCAVRSWAG